MNQDDRRIKRSRKMLADSLFELITERNYREITVKDITDRADIGHRTFYRHFKNIDSLMVYLVINRYHEFQTLMVPFGEKTAPKTNGKLLFDHVQEHQDFFKVIFKNQITDALVPILQEQVRLSSKRLSSIEEARPLLFDMILTQIIDSVFSLIRWWLANEMPYTTIEMGDFYAELIINPAINMLNSK